jgi:hypothetical protein
MSGLKTNNLIDVSNFLKENNLIKNKKNKNNRKINENNTKFNVNNEIILKQNQLSNMKNQELEQNLQTINQLENDIINKDRQIEQTNLDYQNNNQSIYLLMISIVLSLLLLITIILFAYQKINTNLFSLLFMIFLICFILIFLYKFNIFYFQTFLNFFSNRRKIKLEESVTNLSGNLYNNVQESLYGDKKEFIDKNCLCPSDSEDTYIDDEGIEVDIKPGYFYYDNNSPKQLLTPNGGSKINNSQDITEPIYNNIEWVNHDNNIYNDEESGDYQINPNNSLKNGKLVNDITYTINL